MCVQFSAWPDLILLQTEYEHSTAVVLVTQLKGNEATRQFEDILLADGVPLEAQPCLDLGATTVLSIPLSR